MARHSGRRDEEEPEDGEDPTPPSASRRSRRHRPRGSRGKGLEPWAPDGDRESPGGRESAPSTPKGRFGFLHREKEPVYFRARDSLFFEPLVALAIIVVLLVGLYAYTQNWPPLYVVESNSMQHGEVDQLGLINTGDLVLAQKVSADQIVPYAVGQQTGYQTYGEFGDVILYHPNGDSGPTPIIHRAILYVFANPDGTYSAPGLSGLPCGPAPNAAYSVNTPSGCGTSHITGALSLYRIGWRAVTVSVNLDSLGTSSGFLTMGDNNFAPGDPGHGVPDEPGLTSLVRPAWVVGVARGMIPWFGSIKLLLEGNANQVPLQSWQFLGITIVAILLTAVGLHYLVRSTERREGPDDEEPEETEEERPSRFRGLHLWRSSSEEGEEDEEDEETGPSTGLFGKGRPRPTVRRGVRDRGRRHRKGSKDDDSRL